MSATASTDTAMRARGTAHASWIYAPPMTMCLPANAGASHHDADALVYVVEDDAPVRFGIGQLLRAAGHDVRDFATAEACLEAVRTTPPACLLLDAQLPGGTGPEVQATLAREAPDVPVVFMTCVEAEVVIRAFRGGAIDVLLKPLDPDALLHATARAVAVGARSRAVAAVHAELTRRHGSLTVREREVFALIADGFLNKQVAARLGVTQRTVKTHRGRVMQKMGARSLAELVRMADRLDVGRLGHVD
jgi:FixJ family two-component response regulator